MDKAEVRAQGRTVLGGARFSYFVFPTPCMPGYGGRVDLNKKRFQKGPC